MNLLYQRWLFLAKSAQIPDNQATIFFQELKQFYNSPDRFYHNLKHLTVLFHFFDRHQSTLKNPELVEWAIWYHDIIYDVAQKDNEIQSAALAAERLQFSQLSNAQIDAIVLLIEATQKHQFLADTHPIDTPLFLDFDLSILGTDWPTYQQYAQQIRQEYQIYPDEMYNPGRHHALSLFLERERIYYTPHFYQEKESIARENIHRELKELSKTL